MTKSDILPSAFPSGQVNLLLSNELIVVLRSPPQLLRRPRTIRLKWEHSLSVAILFTFCRGLAITWLRLFCSPLPCSRRLPAAASVCLHDGEPGHRGPAGAPRGRSHPNCEGEAHSSLAVRTISSLPFGVKRRLFLPHQQYNFLHEFREKYAAYQQSRTEATERSVSRWSCHRPPFESRGCEGSFLVH